MDSTPIITKVRLTCRSGKLAVSDPCYVDTASGGTDGIREDLNYVVKDCEGTWVGEIFQMGATSWGERVGKLLVRRAELRGDPFELCDSVRVIGSAGVDSGQMLITDCANLPVRYDELLAAYRGPDGQWQHLDCLAHSGGIVTSTGYGDGSYPVRLAVTAGGKPLGIAVDFEVDGE